MATRTTSYVSTAGFVADAKSIVRLNGGRQIDWANVASGYIDATSGKKVLKAGTVIGTLLGSGKVSPRVVTTNPAAGFLETDAVEGDPAAPLSGYGIIVGGNLFENLLPDSAGGPPRVLATAIKTELAANTAGFFFETYTDVR
jgi:hypothetical protein